MMKLLVTCNKCGWVSFGVTREHAEGEVRKFNKYFDEQDQETKDMFGNRKSSLNEYLCLVCKGSDFRPAIPEDCPDGATIGPVIYDKSKNLV